MDEISIPKLACKCIGQDPTVFMSALPPKADPEKVAPVRDAYEKVAASFQHWELLIPDLVL